MKRISLLVALLFFLSSMATAQESLRILSYNILEGMKTDTTKGKQLFVKWINDQDPDILALQEANKFTPVTLAALAKSYGHDYSVIVKESGYPVALTSRFPITDIEKINENITHGYITAKVNGYNIVVLHLNPHHYDKRRAEIAAILAKIAANNAMKKLIVMGDFNSYSPLDKANLTDGLVVKRYKEAKLKYKTHNNLVNGEELDLQVQESILDFGLTDILKYLADSDPGNAKEVIPGKYRIDYIYVSKDLKKKVIRGKFIRDDFTKKFSDHLPLIIELKQN